MLEWWGIAGKMTVTSSLLPSITVSTSITVAIGALSGSFNKYSFLFALISFAVLFFLFLLVLAFKNVLYLSPSFFHAMAQSGLSSPLTLTNSLKTIIPKLVYGTAWKKERTADLVYQALKSGFQGIDTAAQPRHYQENLVGDGVRKAIKDGIVTRDQLYVSYSVRFLHTV